MSRLCKIVSQVSLWGRCWLIVIGVVTHIYILGFEVPWYPFHPACEATWVPDTGGDAPSWVGRSLIGDSWRISAPLRKTYAESLADEMRLKDVFAVRFGGVIQTRLKDAIKVGHDPSLLEKIMSGSMMPDGYPEWDSDYRLWLELPTDLRQKIKARHNFYKDCALTFAIVAAPPAATR